MSPELANFVGLMVAIAFVGAMAVALLARVGAWHTRPAARLTHDEGLRIGAIAPALAAHRGGDDFHLDFGGTPFTFVTFGSRGCGPCDELVRAAASHLATRHMRLVYVSDSDEVDVDPEFLRRWETYRFHDERRTRDSWKTPVSPYFHVIDKSGRVVDKGIANAPEHLDRLMRLLPVGAGYAVAGRSER